MRFGLSLFGVAVTGLVIAAGAASCASSATGQNQVTRLGAVATTARAVAAPADVRRVAGVLPSALTALATAVGKSKVEFHPLPTTAKGQALAQTGQASAHYNGYGFANGYSYSQSSSVRFVRFYPAQAQARAVASASGQSWQLAKPTPAQAKAIGFGTTYYVGSGLATSQAQATAFPKVEVGGAGIGYAYSYAEGTCLYQGGVAGYGQASSRVLADPSIKKNGVVYREANGLGVGTSLANLLTTTVYQSQTAQAYAILVAYPKVAIGGGGKATAKAIGYGDGLAVATGATLVAGNTAATAAGNASKHALAKGTAAAHALATGDALKRQTRVTGTGACRATAQGTGVRICTVKSTAGVRALITASNVRTVTPKLPVLRAVATGSNTYSYLEVQVSPVIATAHVTAQAFKDLVGSGTAGLIAVGEGFNQVNDLVRAPLNRTSTVVAGSRTSSLVYQSRTSTV